MFSTYPPHAAAWFRVAAFKWGCGRNGEWQVEIGSSCDAYCIFQIYRLNLWRQMLLATNSAKQLLFDIVSVIFYTTKYNQYVGGRASWKWKTGGCFISYNTVPKAS